MIRWLAVISIILAAFSAAGVLPIFGEALAGITRRVLRRKRMQTDSAASAVPATGLSLEILLGRIVVRGVPLFSPVSNLLMVFKPWSKACDQVAHCLTSKHMGTDSLKVSELLMVFEFLVGFVTQVLFGRLFVSTVLAAVALAAVFNRVSVETDRRMQRMREQLPDALQCLGFCFLAGCSLLQALEQTADETPEPLRWELVQTADDIQSGIGVKGALAALERRNNLPEISFLAVALEIQHQTGGSLKDLLESAADSVRSAVDLRRQLQVQTAQVRLSYKIVALMPIFLVTALSLSVDGYLTTLTGSFHGVLILATAVSMELAGIMIIRKTLGIDVG
jgi:tight adherence protein B